MRDSLATQGAAERGREQESGASFGHSPGRSPWLSRLVVSAFRNYLDAELRLDPAIVVLTGPNGAGKTNLLEAVSLLAPGRGLRRGKYLEFARHGDTRPWAIAAWLETADGRREIGTGLDPESAGERRLVRVDGRSGKSQTMLGELVDVVWLTPQMDSLWREGPGERRRFLDRLVFGFDRAHAGRVAAYNNALRQRAKLLAEGPADPAWLTALEAEMAERAVAIAAARCDLVTALGAATAAAAGAFPQVGLALAGEPELWLSQMSALQAEERLVAEWRRLRSEDGVIGGSRLGPHRTDLQARQLAKNQPAALSSTGEQKALLLAVVLAHARLVAARKGQGPILLLDEVAAHLDEARRLALFEELTALGLQVWLTGTEPEIFAPLAAQRLKVSDGTVAGA
ncbi:MAG TPA: DNA replication/repair protein RecF [Kiloniellales bacterium]|nr:DNA replication/repair protein RecF [Kiloniellales bacterium]